MSARKDEFRQFFDAEFPSLRRLAYRMTGDWSEAEDLAQEAMVRTYRSWGKIGENPAAYARAVLVNRHRSILRRALVEARHAVRAPEVSPSPSSDDHLVVWDALQELPPRQRAAIVLHYYEDRPQSEVAELLGCPPGTVNSLVFRGLGRLRERLSPDEVPARSETP